MVQCESKSVASYVQSMTDAAMVLRIIEDEAQIVGRTVEGPTPTRFARLCSHFCIGTSDGSGLQHCVR